MTRESHQKLSARSVQQIERRVLKSSDVKHQTLWPTAKTVYLQHSDTGHHASPLKGSQYNGDATLQDTLVGLSSVGFEPKTTVNALLYRSVDLTFRLKSLFHHRWGKVRTKVFNLTLLCSSTSIIALTNKQKASYVSILLPRENGSKNNKPHGCGKESVKKQTQLLFPFFYFQQHHMALRTVKAIAFRCVARFAWQLDTF